MISGFSNVNKKKTIKESLVIFTILLVLLLLLKEFGIFFGKTGKDYVFQHVVLLDNLRANFRITHDFFPQLNMNLGSMTSYVNFTYHWYGNFWTFVSYFIPFSTLTYFVILISTCFSIFYYGLKRLLGYYSKDIFKITLVTLFCTFSGVFIGMFAYHPIYLLGMPFVPLLLIGCHNIINSKGSRLFIVSFIFIVFTSINIVVSAGFTSMVYLFLINKYSEHTLTMFSPKNLFLKLMKNYCMIILCSSVILIPLFLRNLTMARGVSNEFAVGIFNNEILGNMTFDGFALGISLLGIFALIYNLVSGKRLYRVLSIILTICFLFTGVSYVFNYFQYFHSKTFTIFLPIFGILILNLLSNLNRKWIKGFLLGGAASLVFICILIKTGALSANKLSLYLSEKMIQENPILESVYLVIIFLNISLLLIFLFCIYKKKKSLIRITFTLFLMSNVVLYLIPGKTQYFEENVISKNTVSMKNLRDESYYKFFRNNNLKVNQLDGYDDFKTSVYSSIAVADYQDFVIKNMPYNQERSNNFLSVPSSFLSDVFLGNVNEGSIGYAFPIVYGSEKIYNIKKLENNEVLDNPFYLVQGTYVPKGSTDYSKLKEYEVKKSVLSKDEFTGPVNNVSEFFEIQRDGSPGILAVNVDVTPMDKTKDKTLAINQLINRCTANDYLYYNGHEQFSYLIDLHENEQLNYNFSEGQWKIKDVSYIQASLSEVKDSVMKVNEPFETKIDLNHSLSGKIKMEKPGYLVTSIPFDKGYELFIDGKEVPIEKVNSNFIGAKLSAGTHEFKLEYEIPGFVVGAILSAFGFVVLFVFVIRKKSIS